MTARAVLIDPVTRTVTNAEFDGSWAGLVALMQLPAGAALISPRNPSGEIHDPVSNGATGDTLYVRVASLEVSLSDRWEFSPSGRETIGGRGVIAGRRDAGGKFASAVVPLGRVQGQVTWRRREA